MDVYVKELIVPEVLEEDSHVIFIMSTGERLNYMTFTWFLQGMGIANDRIFNVLGISNKNEFVKAIVGYEAKGWFPTVRSAKDLMKVVKALASYNNPKTWITNDDNEVKILSKKDNKAITSDDKTKPFTLSIRKHKHLIMDFTL